MKYVAWAVAAAVAVGGAAVAGDVERVAAALLGDTPMVEDLRELTDTIGGRPTGSGANERAVEWALARFRAAGVEARAEAFTLPRGWSERLARAQVLADGVAFELPIAAMPYSAPTPGGEMAGPLLDAGSGSAGDFARLGERARGAVLLVETPPLLDVPGLFAEYVEASAIEARAQAAGVAALLYVGSRPPGNLYRHNAALGAANTLPLAVTERDAGLRALRLARAGRATGIRLAIDVEAPAGVVSRNVIGEIRGTDRADEIVVIGAHLDSWGLGTGALDNGCNVAMLIDIARQLRRLGIEPRRTIRFVLWNGEEHGLHGSWAYARAHRDELDRHVLAQSYDIGSGRIDGFFTGGRPDLAAPLASALEPVAGLGPFATIDVPMYGTDHFDFLLEGVPTLVASQESANYGPNYHAASDTFERVDRRQLRLNATIAAAVTLGFANMDLDLPRLTRAQIDALIDGTPFGDELRAFHVLEQWERGERGRQP